VEIEAPGGEDVELLRGGEAGRVVRRRWPVAATVRLKGCSSAGVEDAVRDAVLAVAPDLSDVARAPAAKRDAAFVRWTR
jgi:hypothetical protein